VRRFATITLHPLGKTLAATRGASLRTLLHPFGVEFPCGGHGRCGACRVQLLAGHLAVTDDEAVILPPGELAAGWRLACRATVDGDVTLEVGQWDTVILADHSPFDFTPRAGHGVAIDLGTTTVVAQLVDLATGHVRGVATAVNPQTIHGSDIMSRLHVALHRDQREAIVRETRHGVGQLLRRLLRSADLAELRIDDVVIAGNTVMHHLFCDADVTPLSRLPFQSPDDGLRSFRAIDLGWQLRGDPPVSFLPCLGGLVGSDVLCGVLATRMHERAEPIVLLDLGTNGEIVVGNRERILCASTAAGPAFEGGRITMGMRATTGAISEVWIDEGRLRCRVLGDVLPRGLCGSGLVDAVAAGLALGRIAPNGRLVDGGQPLELAPPVRLTQQDIRELQLAKAAIAAGVGLLRARFGGAAAVDPRLYLAGAFGNYVSRSSARRIGLIDAAEDRIEPAGNTALLGAKMALFTAPEDRDFRAIRARVEHVALASLPTFQDTFIDATTFPACL